MHNHALRDVSSKHYDRYDYWDEKNEAIKKWDVKLIETINGDDEKVVQIR